MLPVLLYNIAIYFAITEKTKVNNYTLQDSKKALVGGKLLSEFDKRTYLSNTYGVSIRDLLIKEDLKNINLAHITRFSSSNKT